MPTAAPAPTTPAKTLTIRPTRGMWTFDPPSEVPLEASPDMMNFQVFGGFIRKRPGLVPFGTGVFPTTPVTGLAAAQESTVGTRYLFATTRAALFRYNPGTGNWDTMTGPALAGGDTNLFSFAVSQNKLCFCQGVDNIMALSLLGTTYAVLSSNLLFPARYLRRWNNRLYTAFTSEGGSNKPYRIRWSAFQNDTDWTGLGSGFTDLVDEVWQIQGIEKLLDALAVYTEQGVFLGYKTASFIGPAAFPQVIGDVGLLVPSSLGRYNNFNILIGTDNFYRFNGLQFVPLIPAVRMFVFLQMNPQYTQQGFGIVAKDNQEYFGFIPVAPSTTPNVCWVYNWGREIVYPWSFVSSYLTCGTLVKVVSDKTIAQLVGTIAQQTFPIVSPTSVATYPAIVVGATDGRVLRFEMGTLYDDFPAGVQSPILCRWTSKDMQSKDIAPELDGMMVTLKEIGVYYLDPGTAFTLQFYLSSDKGSWQGPYPLVCPTQTAGETGDVMLTQQITGKRVRFKVENNTTNENPQIVAFSPRIELRRQKAA